MYLKVKKLHPDAIVPSKKADREAGIDIYALEDAQIKPGQTVKLRTGIAIQPEDPLFKKNITVSLLWDRSSLGSKGVHRLAGVIDESYTGELLVCLTNLNIEPLLSKLANYQLIDLQDMWDYSYHIKKGDKIVQLLVQEVLPCKILIVDELEQTDRGAAGFGSSGR